MSKRPMEPSGQDAPDETKKRIQVWLYPSNLEALDRGVQTGNCKSRSEFIERAVQFYAGYLSGQDASAYLPPALVAALNATMRATEDRLCRLLFKLAVEIAIVQNLIAATQDIDPVSLERLRGECVKEVKRLNGGFSFEDALTWQKG